MPPTVLRARWVLPVSREPIANGRVEIENGRIVAAGPATRHESGVIDYGDAIVMPGPVNAHTHLELTCCHGRVEFDGSFVSWIEKLTSLYPGDDDDTRVALQESARKGLAQSLAAGVTTIADIGCGERALRTWADAPVNTVGFLEVLGMGPRRAGDHERCVTRLEPTAQQADDLMREGAGPCAESPLRRLGFSPHAPYSTDTTVYRRVMEIASRTKRLSCTHLAETREEARFLRDGTGPFRELLERRGLWDGSFAPPGCSPVEYAHQLGLLGPSTLLVHVNYASDSDLDRIAQAGSPVVYCPRSHAFFRHEPHRFRDMLARGITVCLGTDSLASNDSLSILDEMRWLRQRDASFDGRQLLTMGTLAGARALGLAAEVGSLEPGKRADLTVVPLSNPRAAEPIEDLLRGGAFPVAVYVAGRQVPPSAVKNPPPTGI